MSYFLGFIFSSLIGLTAYKKEALTKSGVIGAIIVGTAIYGIKPKMSWYIPLILFFISSSLLSFYRKKEKLAANDLFEKTGKRDSGQVLANGGFPVILTVISIFFSNEVIYLSYLAAIAAVNADTWATEIGVLSKRNPRFILNGKKVEKGTSGAVSVLGLIGTIMGAFLIAILSLIFRKIENNDLIIYDKKQVIFLLIIILGGAIGSIFDSFLGATGQAQYKCVICGKITEKKRHCGTITKHIKGKKWLNNDLVNFFSSIIGALSAMVFYFILK